MGFGKTGSKSAMHTQRVQIPGSSNTTLEGMILSNPSFAGKRPAILVIHGWTSSMARYPSRVESLVDMGYLAVLFDLRGHGETGGELGTLSPHDHLNDCLAAFDFMTSLSNADTQNISVIGSSYGGYLASLLTAARKVDHLVLSVPALYPNAIFDSHKGLQRSDETIQYREVLHTPDSDFALDAVNKFRGDLLLLRAENDEVLPLAVTQNYQNAAQVPFTYNIIKDSDHAMHSPGANEERIKIQTGWFKQFISE